MSLRRASAIWLCLAFVALAIGLASLAIGSVSIGPWPALRALLVPTPSNLASEVVVSLRLPRALAGFACGALLSLAGALLQILLRNPLADPYVLGVSGGAATFALLAMMLMLPAWCVNVSAFAGAVAAIAIVLAVARYASRRSAHAQQHAAGDAGQGLLLAGVVLASGWGASITLLLSIASDSQLRGMVFWLTGDLNGAGKPWFAWAALLVALVGSVPVAPRLNVLARGEAQALALGVDVEPLRRRIIVLASLAAAAAVTTAGTIGFVGLVVPHLLRAAFGNDQRMLLPASALAGGALTMAADLIARTALAPVQLPVGALMALMGVPLFIWIMLGRRGHG